MLTATDAAVQIGGAPATVSADRTAVAVAGLRSGQRQTLAVTGRNLVGASSPSRSTGQTRARVAAH